MERNKKLFPQRLWDLIHDEKYQFCLRWSSDGQRVYLNRSDFESHYLKTASNQFHTQKAISFVRQMNMYGFKKVDDCYYENENFKRDCHHLLKNMVRRHSNRPAAYTSSQEPSTLVPRAISGQQDACLAIMDGITSNVQIQPAHQQTRTHLPSSLLNPRQVPVGPSSLKHQVEPTVAAAAMAAAAAAAIATATTATTGAHLDDNTNKLQSAMSAGIQMAPQSLVKQPQAASSSLYHRLAALSSHEAAVAQLGVLRPNSTELDNLSLSLSLSISYLQSLMR